jgi:hypothetical protein
MDREGFRKKKAHEALQFRRRTERLSCSSYMRELEEEFGL